MKKLLALSFVSFFYVFALFANPADNILGIDAAISTGVPIHTAKASSSRDSILTKSTTFKRIIFGGNTDLIFNFSDTFKAMAGADTFCELTWEGSTYYNTMDFSFFGGIKVFPNLAGFNINAAYVFGSKGIFINTEDIHKQKNLTAWGNGFRIGIEYDFFYGEDAAICPIVGGYYRYMPRGDYNYDHIFAAYAGIRF
ncbi:MAG: hypothetical protein MJ188_06050 [Treponema sp.]|nr:hypothetical protein [Treponema sp.]